jgi:hypothetical protein
MQKQEKIMNVLVGVGFDKSGDEICWEYYQEGSTSSSLNYFAGDQNGWVTWKEVINETPITIELIRKNYKHFNMSLEKLMNLSKHFHSVEDAIRKYPDCKKLKTLIDGV